MADPEERVLAGGKVYVREERRVATVALTRPDVHNALDPETIAGLGEALEDLAGRASVVLLRGEGRSFCAGADLAYMKESAAYSEEENVADARRLAGLFATVRDFPGIVIAAVHGATFGGGVGLVAACDVVVASTRARFALSEVNLGLIPAVISPYLVGRMGEGACRAPVLLGYRMDAHEAQRRGLVDRVAEEDEFEEAIEKVLEEARGSAPEAIRECKELLAMVAEAPEDMIERTARAIARVRVGAEAQEGLASFLEKRKPDWS